LGYLATPRTVGAENLRHQVIFVNHVPGAIAPLDPELIQIRDASRDALALSSDRGRAQSGGYRAP
jgi:hypothetical protein